MNAAEMKTPVISSKTLIGAAVKNAAGEVLGEIEEMVVQLENGYVDKLVMAIPGSLFKKRIAIPWDMLAIDIPAQTLILNMDKDFLDKIPAYQGK